MGVPPQDWGHRLRITHTTESLWYATVANMTHFFILFGMRKKMACFELCVSSVLTQNEDIWNFHSSLTLNKGKLT